MNAADERKLVLTVDDAPANLQMMRSILKDDFKIRVATSGAKALDPVKAEPHPDLILLDVMMPQMDGYEVCGLASPEAKDIPAIFLTGMTEAIDETKGFQVGAVDYIHKPFSPAVVKARVHTHLVLREAREQLARQLLEINSELEMAREIQLSILPHEIPKIRGLEIAARHLPMSSAAGDSYDLIIVDEKHLGIVIADVSGHGLPAALIASMLKVALAAQSPHVFDPARVLAGLNQSLCGKFNPPMLLWRPSTGSGSEVLQNGLLLGLFPEATYSVVKVAVEPDLPCSSEVADSVTSVSRRMIWIFTPGIAAPDGSSVLPISAPVEGDCAQRWLANRSTAQSLLPAPKSRVASIPWSHARSHT